MNTTIHKTKMQPKLNKSFKQHKSMAKTTARERRSETNNDANYKPTCVRTDKHAKKRKTHAHDSTQTHTHE